MTVSLNSFLELNLNDFNFRELIQLFEMTLVVVFRRGQLGREKGVDEHGLAQPGFTCRNNSTTQLHNERGTHQQP